MLKTPVPKDGCFQATHPGNAWVEVQCGEAPDVPYLPAHKQGKIAETVGGGGSDWGPRVSGRISKAQGSFPVVMGVQSINNNEYSLQLNSNFFQGPALLASFCQGASNPSSCKGWQQFIYAPGAHIVFMQYWLINYNQGGACPDSSWRASGTSYCFKSSKTIAAPKFLPTQLADMHLIAESGSSDSVTFYLDSDPTIYAISRPSLFGLNQAWTTAEFNVVGGSNARRAYFNNGAPGVTIVVQTLVDSTPATTQAPSCVSAGTTAESNNLTLVSSSCCPFGYGVPEIVSPGIQFMESNVPGMQPQGCPVLPQQMPVAFQGQDTNLWLDQKGVATSQNLGMAPGTVPSLVTLPDGTLEFAAQANTSDLWLSQNGAGTDLGLGMAAHTSPSAVVLPNGQVVVAFQANTGELWLAHDGTGTRQNLGMMAGTSPSAVVLGNGQLIIAAQANTSNLWVSQNGSGTDLHLGMATTASPTITTYETTGYQIAAEANTGVLWLDVNGGGVYQGFPMNTP